MASELFEIGLKVLKSLVSDVDENQDTEKGSNALKWYKFKLQEEYFKGNEVAVFETIVNHISTYSKLPHLETLQNYHPYLKPVSCKEPPEYYRDLLIKRFNYDTLKAAIHGGQEKLAGSVLAVEDTARIFQDAVNKITNTKYNNKLMNLRTDAKALLQHEYYESFDDRQHLFYWDYLDRMANGFFAGDVVSIVGRPAQGKTFLTLRMALMNWYKGKAKPLFVTMEMNPLILSQRLVAMYSSVNLTQLRAKAFATPSEKKFRQGLARLGTEETDFYIVDGNLAATAEEIYMLADNLGCDSIYVDGAYMLKHPNPRLDRNTRVAENVELMKQYTTSLELPTVASWQLNREASKKAKKSAKGGGQKAGLEDIGYSDAIGQISSVVLALGEEESVETLDKRLLSLLKGRNGEIGEFYINWHFHNMNFDEVEPESNATLQHL